MTQTITVEMDRDREREGSLINLLKPHVIKSLCRLGRIACPLTSGQHYAACSTFIPKDCA